MDWREAFLHQAKSDHMVWGKLNQARTEYSHQLHYVQMVTEKLAKGFLAKPGSTTPPRTVHAAFVRMLRLIKGRPDIRRQLGYKDAAVFASYINSLLPLADSIEKLAPASAGTTLPNPEYPWEDRSSHEVTAPALFAFPDFDPRESRMAKMVKLIQQLLRIAT